MVPLHALENLQLLMTQKRHQILYWIILWQSGMGCGEAANEAEEVNMPE